MTFAKFVVERIYGHTDAREISNLQETITGIVVDGMIKPDQPLELPDRTAVSITVEPLRPSAEALETTRMNVIDTNIVVDSFDSYSPAKQQRAAALLFTLLQSFSGPRNRSCSGRLQPRS